MSYTVARLHKELGKLIADGHGRKPVCVNKDTFRHNCESDGVVILELAGMGVQWIPTADDDGGTKWNKDGSQAGRTVLILAGDSGANARGELVQ